MSRTKMRIAQSAVAAYDVKAESDPSFIINNKEKDEKQQDIAKQMKANSQTWILMNC